MPTNLPAEAKHKWTEVSAARKPRVKLQLLKEFMSLVPKHKGNEKLRSQVKKQMAALRREMVEKKRKRAGKGGPKFFIEKEGAAQVAIISLTNAGKSSLLVSTTNAKVEVSPNPYTTRDPRPGMLAYEDMQFQMVETPALMEGLANDKARGVQTLALARNADCLILMLDLSHDPVGRLSLILDEMQKARVFVSKPRARVEVERKFMGAGLQIILVGRFVDCTLRDVRELLKSYRITDAVVKIYGDATLDEVEEAIFESTIYKPAVIVANKIDLEKSRANLKMLKTYVGNRLPVLAISCKTGEGLDRLGEALFKALDVIRIYTKEPNAKECSKRPFVLEKGAKICDLAKNIHSDFSSKFSFAKVWSERLVFSPQRVGLTFSLEDGDVVEIHMK